MSENMEVAIERQRQALYGDRTNEQLIMLALIALLEERRAPALVKELTVRIKQMENRI